MTPRPPQSEETPTLENLNQWLDKTDKYFKLAKQDYCIGCGLTPSEFKQHLATIVAQERALAVRDFGEKVKATMETYDYQIGPEAYIELHEEIDRLIAGEDHETNP